MDAGERLGGAKRIHRSNSRKPWQESHGNQRIGGYRERESRSRGQRKGVMQRGKSEFWDGDRR